MGSAKLVENNVPLSFCIYSPVLALPWYLNGFVAITHYISVLIHPVDFESRLSSLVSGSVSEGYNQTDNSCERLYN